MMKIILYELETQLEIYRRAYNGKINLDDEIQSNEQRLEKLKDKFMGEIESLESEIQEMQQKIETENIDLTKEKNNLNSKYEEAKNNIEEEFLKKLINQ